MSDSQKNEVAGVVEDAEGAGTVTSADREVERNDTHSPAAVGETLRVVRVSKRICRRASRPLIDWLNADCVTPSWAAARVKVPSRATATKDRRSLRLRLIMANSSTDH